MTEAEKNYRIVAGLPDVDYLAVKARWWLDAIEKRKAVQSKLDQLNVTLQALGQELHEQPDT